MLWLGASRYGRHKYFRPHQDDRRLLTFARSKVSKYLRTPPIFRFVLCNQLHLGPPHRTHSQVWSMYRAKCHRGSMAFASCCVCHLALCCLLSKCHSALFIFPGKATPHPHPRLSWHSAIYANHSGEFLSQIASRSNCKVLNVCTNFWSCFPLPLPIVAVVPDFLNFRQAISRSTEFTRAEQRKANRSLTHTASKNNRESEQFQGNSNEIFFALHCLSRKAKTLRQWVESFEKSETVRMDSAGPVSH